MLTDRVFVVTQVTHFVGGGIAAALLAEGARVVAHDPDLADPERRAAFLARAPEAELAGEPDAPAAIAAAATRHGRLDGLVSNDAFPALKAPLAEITAEDYTRTLTALAVQPALNAQAALPHLRAGGAILFVTSAAPLRGLANYAMYAAARAATNSLAQSLARELAPRRIRVNAVAPNYIASPTYFPQSLLDDPARRAKIEGNIPLGRLGSADEVGALAAFLLSDGAGFMTGTVVPVAGGWP